jgi:hypothetical protein
MKKILLFVESNAVAIEIDVFSVLEGFVEVLVELYAVGGWKLAFC